MVSVMASAEGPNDHIATREPLEYISGELYDGHPAAGGDVDDAHHPHLLLRDPSIHHSDLPTRIWSHVAIRHALLTGGVI